MNKGTPEEVTLRYSKRGMTLLKEYLQKDYCKKAAEKLLQAPKGNVLITTGFYVAGYAETDGPIGTLAVAKALEGLGYHGIVITDKYCEGFFELKNISVEYVAIDADQSVYEEILEKYRPVYMISIERCGHNLENEYANMRGDSITGQTACIDTLFELAAEKKIPTIGVGDGGNEIGMELKYAVLEGTGNHELSCGIGHIPDTAGIGEKGNCVLAGHNGSRHGTFFTNLKTMEMGEIVKLTDKEGNSYSYVVESMEVVGPYDNAVKAQGEETELTLITCENKGTMRLIVKCRLQEVE